MLRSLRGRLALLTILTTGLGLGGCSAAIYLIVRHELISAGDDVLLAEARTIASFIEYDDQHQFSFNGQDLIKAGGADLLVSARTATAVEVIPGMQAIPPDPQATVTNPHFWTWQTAEGSRWRAVQCAQRISDEDHNSEDPVIAITLSHPATALDQRLLRIAVLLASLTLGACLTLGAILAWGTRRTLIPLQELSRRLAGLDGRRFDLRLPLPTHSAELVPVVETLNHLLGRIDEAFQRERAMGSALAHELRTPLAGLRAVIDVATSRERDAAAYRRALSECQQMTGQLQGMVESLLLLTRLERGHVPVRQVAVDLAALLTTTWAPFAALAEARGVPLTWELADRIELCTDPELLTIILRNLLANAVAYVDPHGRIVISSACISDRVILRISNTCTRLPPAAETLVFERFWRGDQARSGDEGHCGLGLGLSRDIALALGGTLTATITGSTFTITLDVEYRPVAHVPLMDRG